MADQNSSISSEAAKIMAEATKESAEAAKFAEKFWNESLKATGDTANQLLKMREVYKKIAEQQQEIARSAEDLKKTNDRLYELDRKREKLLKQIHEAEEKGDTKRQESLKKRLAALDQGSAKEKELLAQRRLSTAELEKQGKEQQKILKDTQKQASLLKGIFESGKTQLLAFVASAATMGNALRQLERASQNLLDISILSGNYQALGKSTTELAVQSVKLENSLVDARTGLRFLGYSSEEVDASFKELSVTLASSGRSLDEQNRLATEATIVNGRLARLLGVSLPEATGYTVEMFEKFNVTNDQTAASLYGIFKNSKQFNEEAGRTVIRGRDVTKIMFDLARESRSAAFDQKAIGDMMAQNMVRLQAEGRNYREALNAATLYQKKLTTDAPDFAKILGGQELLKQFKYGEKIGPELMAQLEAVRPGLTKRIQNILDTVANPFTRGQMLQQALGETSVGMRAMNKGLLDLVKNAKDYGDKVNIIKSVYHITETEADSMLKLAESTEKAEKAADDFYKGQIKLKDPKLSGKEREELLKKMPAFYQQSDAASKAFYENQKNREAFLEKLKEEQADTDSYRINKNDRDEKKAAEARMAELKNQIETAGSAAEKEYAQKKLEALTAEEAKKGAEKELGGIQAKSLETVSNIWEWLSSPTGQMAQALAGIIAMAAGQGWIGQLLSLIAGSAAGGTAATATAGAAGVATTGGAIMLGGMAVLGSIGLGAVGAEGARELAEEEEQQRQMQKATSDKVRQNTLSRIKALQAQGGQEEKIKKLQQILLEQEKSDAELKAQYTSSFTSRFKAIYGMEELYTTPIPAALPAVTPPAAMQTVPAAALPKTTPGAAAPGVTLPTGVTTLAAMGAQSGAGVTGARATIIQGAQGTNVELDLNLGKVTIPTAQVHAMNTGKAARGVGGPG